MKKSFLIAYSGQLTAIFFLSGCVFRTVPYEVDRVDQELKGNRGVISGAVPISPETGIKKTRKMYDLEIELFSVFDKEKSIHREEDKFIAADRDTDGNKGYLVSTKEMGSMREERHTIKEEVIKPNLFGSFRSSKIISEKEPAQTKYVVEKGDTLQKISDKIYGTTKRWKKIYEANKNVLDSPDSIKPGQELIIPQ